MALTSEKALKSDFNKPNIQHCRYCNKECHNLNSLKQHELRCKENPNRRCADNLSNRNWAKGLTKDTDPRFEKFVSSIRKYYDTHQGVFTGRKHSEETKARISSKMTEYNHSNNRRHSHGKRGYFDNLYFMSTWELAYYIFSKEHGSNITRCDKRFKYNWEGKYHYYTPDFIEDGIFVEVKGWETALDKIKYELVDNLKVVYYNEVKQMIKFVQDFYNVKDISTLYTGD